MAPSPSVAFVFPGQGSQSVGMGKEVYAASPEARDIFDLADAALGFSLTKLCFEGPEEDLRLTVNVQPAIVTFSLALLAAVKAAALPVEIAFFAGHSLGEYSSLAAAGVISNRDAILLSRERGRLMYQAGVQQPGVMAAIIGLTGEAADRIAAESGVFVANYNCPGQIVISGETAKMEKARTLAAARGAAKVVPLAVSGAFHTPLMQPAAEGLRKMIDKMSFNAPSIPIIGNADARPLVSIGEVKDELVEQLTHPVQWQKSIEYMIYQGVSTFVEIGPGKVLSGLIKRIDRQATILNVSDTPSLGAYIEKGVTQ